MSVRNDVVIDWNVSPRIITVLSPSLDILIQDLVDTCRFNEEKLSNIQYPHIVSASGKDDLGDGVTLGITATLLNAKLSFQARPGPTFVTAKIKGGNLVAVNASNETMDAVLPTSYVNVFTLGSVNSTITNAAEGSTDWSSDERAQIRHRLGIDGTVSTPSATPSLVAQVWNYVSEGLPVITYVKRMVAALFGRTSGVGTSTETFKSMDGTKDRIQMQYDVNGNRVNPTFDDS